MKPDKFDEAIRQKLEGIQPSFQDDDWSKFTAYQATHTSTPFFQRFSGRTAWYTAASVAATMMVFANVYQYQKNKQLDREVVELKANIAKQKDAPVRVTTRVDTVYITKYIEVKSSQLTPYDATVPSLNDESPDETTGQGEAVAERLKNVGKIIRQNPDSRISDVFERVPKEVNTTTNEVSNEVENNEFNKDGLDKEVLRQRESTTALGRGSNRPEGLSRNSARTSSRPKATSPESVSTKNNSMISQKSTQKSASIIGTYKPANVSQAETQGVDIAQESSESEAEEIALLEPRTQMEELAGIPPAEAKVERYAYTKLSNPSSTATSTTATSTAASAAAPPSISFKNMKFRMGVGLNIGDKLTSYSGHTSLLLGKFWSLNIGLAKTYITGPQYYTEDIFKAKTQRDFKEWNKKEPIQSPMAPPQAFNISTSANLWQMPISLTYRWPVKDGFTFLLSGGTNLNLSTSQQFSYFIRERNGEIEEKQGKFTLTPSLSNDIIAAAGVEKQWKNLVVQAETYIAPYVQKPSYLTENRNIGIRFKVLYQFGKKSI